MKKNCIYSNLAGIFKALCDNHRLFILSLIKNKKDINVSEIVKNTNLTQPTVSHHLKIMSQAGIITSQKKGKEVFYNINHNQIKNCCGGFVDDFCPKRKKTY